MDFKENDDQDLYLKDFTSFRGVISRPNFRAVSILAIGLAICIYLLPGLFTAAYVYDRGQTSREPIDGHAVTVAIAPFIHAIGFGFLGYILLVLSVKRMRDSGKAWWYLLFPGYNLWILLFAPSKNVSAPRMFPERSAGSSEVSLPLKKYNLIFLRDKMLLSRKEYPHWTAIQDEFENYMASLDFETLLDVQDYIMTDYHLSKEKAEEEIGKLDSSGSDVVEILIAKRSAGSSEVSRD